MAQIGSFTRTGDGYTGRLQTLTLDAELTLVPVEATDAENAPDYRIHLGSDAKGSDIGAGWKRNGEKAGDYVSLLIDDPAFLQPIRANLFQSAQNGKSFHLLWSRPSKHEDRR